MTTLTCGTRSIMWEKRDWERLRNREKGRVGGLFWRLFFFRIWRRIKLWSDSSFSLSPR